MSDLEGPSGVSEEDKIDSGNSSPRDHSTPVGLIVKYIGQVAELTDSVAENSRKFLEGINSAEFRGETDVEALTVALAEKFDNYVAQLQGRPLPSLCETNKDNYRLAWDATTEIGSQVEEAADQSGLRQQNVELAETCRQLSAALSRSEQMQEKIRQFCTEFAKENLQVEVSPP